LRSEGRRESFSHHARQRGWLRGVYGDGKGEWFNHDSYFADFERLNNDELTALLMDDPPRKDAGLWVKLAGYIASRITRDPETEIASASLFAEWAPLRPLDIHWI
jgi:hypothetical protein